MLGDGFMPSEELRALGKFQNTSINISNSSQNGVEESIIFLRLENGDPKIMAENRELLARKCAELYLSGFEKKADYEKITIQFVQTDPYNPENVSQEEYTFATQDF
jgi:tRNA G10  N-methylase Trm11